MTLVVACVFHASAGGTSLSGVVYDANSLRPVSGLVVEAGEARVETDENGGFALTGLGAGERLVKLRGHAGEGRVRVSLGAAGATALLFYPVYTTVALLHDNDLHFNFNHRQAFSEEVEAIRARFDNVYLLSAGDLFVRHPDRWRKPNDTAYYRARSMDIISAMNELGYHVCTPGNHELGYIDTITKEALDLSTFVLLGANVVVETDHLPGLEPWTLLETDNALQIAVLGLTRDNSGRDGVRMLDPLEVARGHQHLAEQHELFVALTHLGLGQDRELAEAVPELDIIIGGHSHHLLQYGETAGHVLLAMAGGPPARHQEDEEWPKYLGIITVHFENERVISKTARVLTITSSGVSGGE